MRIPPHVLDEIRARLPVSTVVSRRVDLKRAGRELKGLSPFKQERTPSFFVCDEKGFYHCFASGSHGDIFKFVMETEGLSFREAAERLAADAGVELPKREPESEAERAALDQRERLIRAHDMAARHFRANLAKSRDASEYLAGRGLSPETIAEFGLGYAPEAWGDLKAVLLAAGHAEADLVAGGLLREGERSIYDAFRDRVMIPIHDVAGRLIAFGGRSLDPSVEPKYLNSPETPLFHKGATLFNVHRARASARSSRKPIIIAEGYFDVIALAAAGFPEAVAPLGTAITAQQLRLIWRVCPVPVLMLDGDAAGQRAADLALDVVLPMLAPGHSLRVAYLPAGYDPDELIQDQGPATVQAVIAGAIDLVDAVWRREWRYRGGDSPEARAAFERRLDAVASSIQDKGVSWQYRSALRQRAREAFRGLPRRVVKSANDLPDVEPAREAWLVVALIDHPALLDDLADDLAALEIDSRVVRDVRDAMLRALLDDPEADPADLLVSMGLGPSLAQVRQAASSLAPTIPTPESWRGMADVQRKLSGRHLARA